MRTRPTIRSTILAIVFATLVASCATADPLTHNQPTDVTAMIEPEGVSVGFADPAIAGSGHAGSIPATSTTSTTTTTTTIAPALTAEYEWGERSDDVRWLQRTLRVEADGVYGPVTQMAHAAALEAYSMTTDAVPTRPAAVRSAPSRTFADAPAPVLAAIHNLWPEHEWARAQAVAWCESNYRLDAANPSSSARGVFQLLAPWTRDPGSGREVWGWEYTADGEKLSAAAGLGIAENDARYGLANITIAHLIWQRSGWGPWAASQTCWAE